MPKGVICKETKTKTYKQSNKIERVFSYIVRKPDNVTFFSQISLQKLKVIVILITSSMVAMEKKEEESFYRGAQLRKQTTQEWKMTNSLIFLLTKTILHII